MHEKEKLMQLTKLIKNYHCFQRYIVIKIRIILCEIWSNTFVKITHKKATKGAFGG